MLRTYQVVMLFACTLARGTAACTVTLGNEAPEVHVADQSTVAALLQFGYQAGVCLGMESPGIDLLTQPAAFSPTPASILQVIKAMVGSRPYQVSERDGVILIRSSESFSRSSQLDVAIPEYRIPKMSLAWASFALFTRLTLLADPSRTGIAGALSDRNQTDTVGPLEEHGRPARDLLTLMVGRSSGAAWISGLCAGQTRGEDGPCWSLLDYKEDASVVGPVIRSLVDKLTNERRQNNGGITRQVGNPKRRP